MSYADAAAKGPKQAPEDVSSQAHKYEKQVLTCDRRE
jgi:hypothetical protein